MTGIDSRAKLQRSGAGFSIAGLGIATFCGAAAVSVGLLQATAADRLVDRNYDQAIAVATALQEPKLAVGQSGKSPGLLRLAAHPAKPSPNLPTAATEHAWLTRSLLPVDRLHADPTGAEPSLRAAAIGSAVGTRFTVTHAGASQLLEVIDISEISSDQLHRGSPSIPVGADPSAKLLMVSCRIVDDAKTDAQPDTAGAAEVIRFIVSPHLAHPVGLPRVL